MTNKEILEKAIQKAIDGGWDSEGWDAGQLAIDCVATLGGWHTNQVIFNHDFAKALWGEDTDWTKNYVDSKTNESMMLRITGTKQYIYHLKHMVISDDPIKYLGENI